MNRRTLLIIIISGIVLVAIAIGVVWWRLSPAPDPTDNTNQSTNTAVTPTNANANTSTPPVVNTNPNNNTNNNTNTAPDPADQPPVSNESDQAQLLRLARTIVERYGSFSNRNNFENITSLEAFMTEDFKQRSLAYIQSQKDQPLASEFYGISTSVLSLELTNYTAGQAATALVATRRIEERSHQDPVVTTQYATVVFQSAEGNWKVDSISWK